STGSNLDSRRSLTPLVLRIFKQTPHALNHRPFVSAGDQRLNASFFLYQTAQDVIQIVIGWQGILILLTGSQFGRGRFRDDMFWNDDPFRSQGTFRPLLVTPARKIVDCRLVDVLEHIEAATHVSIESGVADARLRLVTRRENHVAK